MEHGYWNFREFVAYDYMVLGDKMCGRHCKKWTESTALGTIQSGIPELKFQTLALSTWKVSVVVRVIALLSATSSGEIEMIWRNEANCEGIMNYWFCNLKKL